MSGKHCCQKRWKYPSSYACSLSCFYFWLRNRGFPFAGELHIDTILRLAAQLDRGGSSKNIKFLLTYEFKFSDFYPILIRSVIYLYTPNYR